MVHTSADSSPENTSPFMAAFFRIRSLPAQERQSIIPTDQRTQHSRPHAPAGRGSGPGETVPGGDPCQPRPCPQKFPRAVKAMPVIGGIADTGVPGLLSKATGDTAALCLLKDAVCAHACTYM